MERCEEIRGWLGPFADGELGRADRRKVESHLESCPRCRAEVEEIRALDAALSAEARGAEPPGEYFATLPERVRARFDFDQAERRWIRAEGSERPRNRPASLGTRAWFRLALATATVAVVALVIRMTQPSPLRPRSVEVRMEELAREYRRWRAKEPDATRTGADEALVDAAEPKAEALRSREAGALEPAAPESDTSAEIRGLVEVPPFAEVSSRSERPPETEWEEIEALLTEAPVDTVAAWGRDLALVLAGTESIEGAGAPEEPGARTPEPAPAATESKIATRAPSEPPAPSIGPADLLLREADPSLPDSVWVRGWRLEARRLADLALRSSAQEHCRVALAAYQRCGRRGGREIFADDDARRAAFAPERRRIEALLRCLEP